MERLNYLNEKKTQLVYKNFKFQCDSRTRKDGSRFYKCVEYKAYNCSATLSVNDVDFTGSETHSHLPMLPIEAEYLINVETLKQSVTTTRMNMDDIKREYQQIYERLDQKHGRLLLSPHWRSWAAVRTMFNKIITRSSQGTTINKRTFEYGLKIRFLNDQEFRFWVKRFCTLALIPLENLDEAWNIILDETPSGDEPSIFKLIKYFVNTWLIGKHGSHCIPSIWNRFEEEHRTTGSNEAYHRRMNKDLSPHSSLPKVIDFFKMIDSEASQKYLSIKNGTPEAESYNQKKKVDKQFNGILENTQKESQEPSICSKN